MASNRRRHANAIPLTSIFTWVMIFGCFAGSGLGYVYLKNKIHRTGTEIKKLEQELAELKTQDEVVRSKIASLSSRAAMERRLKEGFVKLAPITDDCLVRVDATTRRGQSELRAVSNERGRE